MSNNNKKHNNLPRGNGYKSNRASPQSFPQTMTTPDDISRGHVAMVDFDEGTSPPINEGITDGTTTHHRPCDDMRPLPTSIKNRHVYTEADMHAISSGGVTDHTTHMPTLPNTGNRW